MIIDKVVLVLFFSQLTLGSENPGIQITLGAKGLDLARRIASQQLSKTISKLQIKHLSFRHGEINNLHVTSFKLGQSTINTATPNWVTLGVKGTEISLWTDWKYAKYVIFKLKFKGSARLNANHVDISQTVGLSRNKDGKPILIHGPCSANIGKFNFKLKGHFDVKIINFFAHWFSKDLRKMIQNQICPNIRDFINKFNTQTVNNLKVDYPISKNISINVALALDPTASPDNITAAFRGRFYSPISPPMYPFPNPPIPKLNMTSQMARVMVGDYSINTLLYTLWQYGKLNWTFPQPKIDETIGTNVTADLLAKTMPVFKKYEHSGVSLKMVIYTVSSPLTKVIPNGVDVSGPFGFQIFVLLGNHALKVFDVPLNVDLVGKVNVDNNTITVQVENLNFSASDLGGFPSKFLSKLLNAAVPSIILPALNEAIGKAPFMLPSYFGYEFSNFNVQFDPDFLVISSDVKHKDAKLTFRKTDEMQAHAQLHNLLTTKQII